MRIKHFIQNKFIYRDYALGSYFRDTLIPGAYGILTEQNSSEVCQQSELACVLGIVNYNFLQAFQN